MQITAHNRGRNVTVKQDSDSSSNATFWAPASGKTIVLDGFVVCVTGSADAGNYIELTDGTNKWRFGAAGGATGAPNWIANGLNARLEAETTLQITVTGTVVFHVTVWGHEVIL